MIRWFFQSQQHNRNQSKNIDSLSVFFSFFLSLSHFTVKAFVICMVKDKPQAAGWQEMRG